MTALPTVFEAYSAVCIAKHPSVEKPSESIGIARNGNCTNP